MYATILTKPWFAFLAPLILVTFASTRLNGDLVYLNSQADPIVGRIRSQNARTLEFEEVFASGTSRIRTISAAQVSRVIKTIDPRRLEQLDPTVPQAYLEYAEELSGMQFDFLARRLAARLYLIGSFHGTPSTRASCLLGLLDLENSPTQRQRIRALAIVSLPSHWAKPFRPSRTGKPGNLQDLRQALRAIRHRKMEQAQVLLNKPGTKSSFPAFVRHLDWLELVALANKPTLSLNDHLALIELENLIGATDRLASSSAGSAGSSGPSRSIQADDRRGPDLDWLFQVASNRRRMVEWVTFTNLTPFDPTQSIYRSGQWVQPPGNPADRSKPRN